MAIRQRMNDSCLAARFRAPLLSPTLIWAAALLAGACTSDAPTSLDGSSDRALARPTSGPAVNVLEVDPPRAPQNATLDVRVRGSGYDDGSAVSFELAGQPATEIQTNSTAFVSQRELVANITIEADAEVALYDVVVTTTRGKRGVGIESFEVTSYELVVVGALPGAVTSAANDVNANGEVVGWSQIGFDGEPDFEGFHAFYWHAGVLEDIGSGFAFAISSACAVGTCRVVGFREDANSGFSRPIVWERQGGVWTSQELPAVGRFGSAWAINPRGDQISGNMDAGGEGFESIAVVWTENGGVWTATPLPPASETSNGYGVNDVGQVVGRAGLRAMVWTNSGGAWTATELDVPPGFVSDEALARKINNLGDIVGAVGPLGGHEPTSRAVLWRRTTAGWDRGMDLGILGRSTGQFFEGSRATDINDTGQVVGLSGVKGQRFLRHPFVWTEGTGMVDIGTFRGPQDAIAFAISDNGWIAGTDNENAILWIPSPSQ